jgi:hypothetical protein
VKRLEFSQIAQVEVTYRSQFKSLTARKMKEHDYGKQERGCTPKDHNGLRRVQRT